MMPVLVIVPDLIFSTKIFSTARSLQTPAVGARTLEAMEQHLASGVSLVFLDLNASSLDPLEAIRRIRALPSPPPIVAFLSHTQQELAAAARSAGAETVLPRSAFSTRLPYLLQSAGSQKGRPPAAGPS